MSKRWIAVILSVLFLAAGTFVHAQDAVETSTVEIIETPVSEDMGTPVVETVEAPVPEAPLSFGGIVTDTESGSATVEDIDMTARTVTLKNEVGEVKTVTCGPEVRNFDQIRKGDKVTLTVSQYAEVTVMKGTDVAPVGEEDVEVARAPLGEKPAAIIEASLKVMAVVEDINYESRIVTLKGPERMMMVKVGPEAENFDNVKKGDNVYVELDEIVEIVVTAPAL